MFSTETYSSVYLQNNLQDSIFLTNKQHSTEDFQTKPAQESCINNSSFPWKKAIMVALPAIITLAGIYMAHSSPSRQLVQPPIETSLSYSPNFICTNDFIWRARTKEIPACPIGNEAGAAISNVDVPGSQRGNNNGICDARKIFEELKNYKTQFVEFKEEHFDEKYVAAGACTSMSLDFAARVENDCHPHQLQNTQQLINCISDIAHDYNAPNEILRNRQAAFNAIAVDSKAPDPARAKIEALVSYHSFSVDLAIPSAPITEKKDAMCDEPLEEFIKEVNAAPLGTYFLRTLQLSNNHKLEGHGHSTILIKTENGSFYYDPSHGVKGLSNCNLGERIYNFIFEDAKKYFIS